MIESITAVLLLVIAFPVAGAPFRLINESVETVAIWDYQAGLHFRRGQFLKTLESGQHPFRGRGNTVFRFDTRLRERESGRARRYEGRLNRSWCRSGKIYRVFAFE